MDRRGGGDRRSLLVSPDEAGSRLDALLARRCPDLSRSRIQALIADGRVLLDGRRVAASARVRAAQRAEVEVPEPAPATAAAENLPLVVVHDDPAFLVVDKPAGLVVHPGAGRASGTLVNALLHHVRDLSGVGGALRPGIVHRLDAGTSGLLVVAKNDAAHRALARQFECRTVEKEYLALVHGSPPRAEGTIAAPVGRHPVHRQRMAVRAAGGREARSSYRVVETFDGASLVRVRIHTGRTHQIRVHLASIGCPLVGDRTYGGKRTPAARSAVLREALSSFPRPALHAARLCFDHPLSAARLEFAAPVPSDLAALLDRLRVAGSPPKH